jgi:Flp pilus assembly protein TadD
MKSFWKGFAWGFAIFAVTSALAWNSVRVDPDLIAPKPEPPAATASVASDEALFQLEQMVRSNPEDMDLRLKLANEYFIRKNTVGVAEQTRQVLARNPQDPRALTFQAFVHISNGEVDAADVLLNKAVSSDPNYLDAWVAIAFLKAQTGKMDEADAAIAEAKRRHPEDTARLEGLEAELKRSKS